MGAIWNDSIKFLAEVLTFFHRATGDWGLSVILLTVAVRVVLLPLTIKQTRSMHELQRIQPKLKALQEKHKNDKQKMQDEMMKLYQENKVNPLGGCLPTLLQLPVMIALFNMLMHFKPEGGGKLSFLGLLSDLSLGAGQAYARGLAVALPYILLLAIVVVTTYLPQKMMNQDPKQKQMMVIMSGMMAFIGWSLPSGVMLYWVTTNLWTMAQQWTMLRYLSPEGGKADGS